jgi:hypothetical protein
MAPHSTTVRGTLSNPKTKEAMKNPQKNPTLLGDPGSLISEKFSDSKEHPIPDRTEQDGATFSNPHDGPSSPSKPSSTSPGFANPTEQNEARRSGEPHSAGVRGTLSNPRKVDKVYKDEGGQARSKAGEKGENKPRSMLGDPTSLTAEKRRNEKGITEDDRGVGTEDEDGMKRAAEKRQSGEVRNGGSKL